MVRLCLVAVALGSLGGIAIAQPAPASLPAINYPTAFMGATATPAPPRSRAGQAQTERNRDGHFYMQTGLNNASVRMMVDTGATTVLLRWEDAVSAGLNPETMSFSVPSSTPNGRAYIARARIRSLTVGGISRADVPVFISKAGASSISLLGQSFLAQLATLRISGDTLLLQE